MAFGGAQDGGDRGDGGRAAERRPDREDAPGWAAPGTAARHDALSAPGRSAAATVTAAPPGRAPRQDRRSQSFPYATKAFQGGNLNYAILTQPSQGWVTNNGDGTFSFDPGLDFRDLKPGETRRVSFSYQVSDGWSGAETESATLTVTGSADGTLRIEATAGNAARRAARPWPGSPPESPAGADSPPEPPAPSPIEPIRQAVDPGGAPGLGAAAAFPAAPAPEPEPDQAVESTDPEPEPEPGAWAPPVREAGADPLAGSAGRPEDAEAPPAPDPGAGPQPEPQTEPEMTAPALEAPADLRPPAGHETAPVAPPAAGLGADPLDPGPRPGDQGWRYAILAQPQEGRVRTTDDGGFDFTPGADFPTLAVGELEQVSFTCEATDDAGARSIVIASLTVTGTADGPEICDVTYRQAQGTEAARRTTPEAGLGRSEGAPRAAAAEQDADDRPAPSPSGPVVDGAAGPLRPVVAGPAEPDRNKVAAAAGLDDEARVELPEAAPAGATTDPADDWPSWRSDAAIGVDAFEREPALAVEPAADDLAVPDSGEVETMGDPHGEAEGEPTAWEATTVTQSPPLRREEAWSADIGSDHQGPDAASGIPTGGPAPQDGGSVAITTGPAGGPRNERPTPDEIGEDRRPRDSYRGAVAAEAVATLLPDEPGAAAVGRLDVDPNSEAAPEEPASGPASTDGLAPSGRVPDRQAAILDGLFGAPDSGGPAAGEDRDASQDDPAMPAEPAAEVPPMAGPEPSAHGGDAWQASDALGEADEMPGATGAGTMDDEDLDLAAADDDTAESAELTDFSLSRDTVVEKSEAGTVVGQVLVAGAERGARFIFDLQNDAGGRFDINPRTGKVTVADGALLDHAAADHHDILVQVIAHSGVSCRKTLTIQVLPAGAAQAADPPQTAEGAAFEGRDATRHPALRAELGLAAELDSVSDAVRPDDGATGGSVMDTLRLDGVSGGPGLGSWTLELTAGEVVETNDDNLMLSPNSTGIVILEGCPVNVAFEGVERIEW